MYPKIEVGDVVLMRITDENTDIDEGDIVAYKLNNAIVVHRVKEKISNKEYITQGDNNNIDDGVIYREEIIAKNFLAIPKLGLLMNIINPVKNILGFITFILFVGATFFFCESLVKIIDPYFNYHSKKEDED